MKRELLAIQSQIDKLHSQANENLEQIMEFLEETQAKRHITVKKVKRSVVPDPDEVNLKKWRHLGVGENKDGAFVMLHDSRQSRLFVKHGFAKPSWQIKHFDHT